MSEETRHLYEAHTPYVNARVLTRHDGPVHRPVYVLEWDDGVANEWEELFPTEKMARRRLGNLVQLGHNELFDIEYAGFLAAHMHPTEVTEWFNRGYVDELRAFGHDVAVFNSGGGIHLIETLFWDGELTTWGDDIEGHGRIGIYPTELIEDGHPSFMLEFEDSEYLNRWHAQRLLDLINTFAAVRHIHDWITEYYEDQSPGQVEKCKTCGKQRVS